MAKSLDEGALHRSTAVSDVADDEYILDLGLQTTKVMVAELKGASTVIWNGTLGLAEQAAYARASVQVAQALTDQQETTMSLIGGGDTVDFILDWMKQNGGSFMSYFHRRRRQSGTHGR